MSFILLFAFAVDSGLSTFFVLHKGKESYSLSKRPDKVGSEEVSEYKDDQLTSRTDHHFTISRLDSGDLIIKNEKDVGLALKTSVSSILEGKLQTKLAASSDSPYVGCIYEKSDVFYIFESDNKSADATERDISYIKKIAAENSLSNDSMENLISLLERKSRGIKAVVVTKKDGGNVSFDFKYIPIGSAELRRTMPSTVLTFNGKTLKIKADSNYRFPKGIKNNTFTVINGKVFVGYFDKLTERSISNWWGFRKRESVARAFFLNFDDFEILYNFFAAIKNDPFADNIKIEEALSKKLSTSSPYAIQPLNT